MVTDTAQSVDFTLPSLGSDMDEGTVLTWLVEVGDTVTKGDVLLRVDTEKADIDVEVWHDAKVLELLVEPGDVVPVGTPLARLETSSATAGAAAAVAPEPTAPPPTEIAAPTPASTPPAVQPSSPSPHAGSRVRATPRLVYWPAATAHATEPKPVEEVTRPAESRADRRQGAVAALMERSNREIPHFHLVRQIDLTALLEWLDAHNESVPPPERILPAAVILYAVAKAAQGSTINGTFDDGAVDSDHVDLGVAVHVRGGGLMTPVLPAAEELTLDELMRDLQALVGRARSSRLSTRDMTAATLTVTNLGDAGADRVLGVIRPPERALVGVGRIAERAVVIDGELAGRRTADFTLTADHRVVNGHAGARFLDRLDSLLSRPDDITLAGGTS